MATRPACARSAGCQPLDVAVLRASFEHAPVAVGVCDGDGRFIAANPMLGQLLGFAAAELVGRSFLTFVHPDARSASLAKYFESVVAAAAGSLVRSDSHELPCVAADGSVVWVAVTWTMTTPDQAGEQYGVVHLLDITERRRSERQLAELHQRFELAFQCSPIGFAIIDLGGRVIQANPALQAILGYSQEQLCARTFLDITHPDDRAASRQVFQRLMDGGADSDTSTKRYRAASGATIYARRVAAVLRDGSTPRYFLLQIEDITGEHEARVALREHATRDRLTGLATREALAEELAITPAPRSMIVISLNDLPRLNGALGREGTDHILVTLARRLSASCRPQDRVARVSSTQFAVLVNDKPTVATTLSHRITAALATPVAVGQRLSVVNASVATVDDPSGEQDLDSLLRCGDLAISSEPAARSWTQFSPAMLTASTRQAKIEAELRAAGKAGLGVVYQPIVDLATGSTVAFEALSRWHHPTLGQISPAEFIPAAIRSGLLDMRTMTLLETACTDLATWTAATPDANTIAVAVNIAPQLLSDPSFAARVIDVLAAHDIRTSRLILEITEDALLQESGVVLDNLRELRAAGIRIAIDDFGTGQSNLVRLARFPVTEVKLDASFLADVRKAGDQAPLVRAAITMAAELGLTVTVEGVESDVQMALLCSYRCPQAQGFLLGRPEPATTVGERFV